MEFHKPPFRLKEIKVEVTQRCNLQCIHCSSEGTSSHPIAMRFDKAVAILKEAADMGVTEVAFSGGEPLLWPQLDAAISKASASGMEVLVYTSGNVDDPRPAMAMLAENRTRRVIFSVFGTEDKVHDSITRVDGSLEKTLAAVDEAIRAGLEVEFHFVPMRINYKQLPGVIVLGQEKGAKCVSVLRFVPHGRGRSRSELALTHEQNLHLKLMIEDGRKRMEVRTGSPYNFLLVNETPRCFAAVNRLTISPDLRIYPCDGFKNICAERIAGTDEFSQLDRWTLAECWQNSPYLKRVREYLTTPFGEPCAGCRLLESCVSGCLAQKVIVHGHLAKSPDPMCLLSSPGRDASGISPNGTQVG